MKVIQLHNNSNKLIKAALKNKRSAQQALYEMYAPKMLSVCRYYIKDSESAEEIMLDGFFKVFTNLDQFQFKGSFEGWVRKIMVREAISFIRKQKQVEFVSDYKNVTNVNLDFETSFETEQLQNFIDNLPEGYKMVFVMSAIEGYKHAEIAKMLQISEGTSKSQLFKARQMLQTQIKELSAKTYGTK